VDLLRRVRRRRVAPRRAHPRLGPEGALGAGHRAAARQRARALRFHRGGAQAAAAARPAPEHPRPERAARGPAHGRGRGRAARDSRHSGMDRARVAILLALVLSACAHEEPAKIELVGQDCRIALPYVKTEIGDCTPRSAAAYDFAFCHLHFLVGALAAPDRSAEYRRRAIVAGNVSRALSNAVTFQRNVELAKSYYESLQK